MTSKEHSLVEWFKFSKHRKGNMATRCLQCTRWSKIRTKEKTGTLVRVLFSSQTISWVTNTNRSLDWNKLVRMKWWVSWFLNNSHSIKDQRKQGSLDTDELQESAKGIITNAQKQSFFEEYERLAKGNTLPNSSNILVLKPQLDEEGLQNSCGRLQNVTYLSYDVKYPIILPRGHIVSKLIIKQHHKDSHLAIGNNQLLAKLLLQFCIVSTWEAIQEVEKNCNE